MLVGAGEMDQWLIIVLGALAEDPDLLLSTDLRWFTTAR